MAKSRYCQNCGSKLKTGSNFCEGCGKGLKQNKNHSSSKERPTFLNVWLILMIIGNAFALIAVAITPLILPIIIVNFICIWALYNWKIWGFYGYIIMAVFALFLNASISGGTGAIISIISAIVGTTILYFAMKPVWDEFE